VPTSAERREQLKAVFSEARTCTRCPELARTRTQVVFGAGEHEVRVVGSRAVRLYPLFHPAAALYTRALLDTLRADFGRLPALLALAPPEQPERIERAAVPEPALAAAAEQPREPVPDGAASGTPQLGLFD
jgi:hypothetical protein